MQSKEDLYEDRYWLIQKTLSKYILTDLKHLSSFAPRVVGNVSCKLVEGIPEEVFHLLHEDFVVWTKDIIDNVGGDNIKQAIFIEIEKSVCRRQWIEQASWEFPEEYRDDLTEAGYEYLREYLRTIKTDDKKHSTNIMEAVKDNMQIKYKELEEKNKSWTSFTSDEKMAAKCPMK